MSDWGVTVRARSSVVAVASELLIAERADRSLAQ